MAKKRSRKARAVPPEPSAPEEDEFGEDEAPAAASKKKVTKKKVVKKKARSSSAESADESEAKPTRPKRTTVTLEMDKRKISKKKRAEVAAEWDMKNRGKKLDSYFAGQVSKARRSSGHKNVFLATEMDNLVIGIPCPSLAFEYVLAQDCFPLGLIMHLVGPPSSLKSALLYEIYRWFIAAGGGGILNEVETKISPDLLPSIIGKENNGRVIIEKCDSVESWQEMLTYWIEAEKKGLTGTAKEPGPGRTIPIVYGVDSIMGKASWETQEKVASDGFAGRNFPVEALSITTYMKTVPQMIDGWPFALVLNNHLKMRQDDKGNAQRNTAGGSGVNFQESWEIESTVTKRKIECGAWEGKQVKIRCWKNSMGPGDRWIMARMLWWDELNEATGNYEQVTIWDWDWSTIYLLSVVKGKEKARLNDMGFHLETPTRSDVENTAWSKNLGMKAEDAVSWAEVGAMLRKDEKLMGDLRLALGIKSRPYLAGDYVKQLNELRQEESD